MRKSLSILLAITMVFSMFGSLAFAAEPELTAQQQFEALKEKGIFVGINEAGDAGLDQDMTRAEFARVAALLLGLDVDAMPAVSKFTDVGLAHWAVEEIHAVEAAGVMTGNGNGTFTPASNVTIEQVARVLVDALGIEIEVDAEVAGASNWAQGYVKAAIGLGLISATADFQSNAKRELLVTSAYSAYQAIAAADVLTVTTAQSGTKKITVNFNKEVTAAEKADLTYDVKFGLVPYTVTATYAEDNMSVTLESSFAFPAGDYTVTVKGFEALTVKVEAEKVAKVEIGATSLQKAAGQDLKVKAYNQFDEEILSALSDANITVFNGTQAVDLTLGVNDVLTNGVLNLTADGQAKIDDTIVVTASHPGTGISASKTYKVVAASSAASMTFGPVAPLKDKVRITVSESDITIPYTLVDQYGATMELALGGDITFVSSNNAIVNPASFAVDADGVLTFDAGATDGIAIITALNAKTGASTFFQIVVEDTAKVKTFQMSNPGVLVAASEAVKIPFAATDSFGAVITKTEFGKTATNSQVTFTDSSATITTTHAWNTRTGELTLTFTAGTGQNIIYAWVDGQIASQFTVDVKAAAAPVKITGIKDLTTQLVDGGTITVDLDNLNVVDTYGRAVTELTAPMDFTVAVKDATINVVSVAGKVITGEAVTGTKTIVVELNNGAPVANSKFEFNVKVIDVDDVATYELEAIDTIYNGGTDAGYASSALAGLYAKTITVVGKDASNVKTAIVQAAAFTAITSTDGTIVAVDNTTDEVYGKKAGTATVAVWYGATKLAEVEVTVSNAAAVATTVTFDPTSYTLDISNVDTQDFGVTGLEIKDQYGVVLANPETLGVWSSSDAAKASVDANGLVTPLVAGDTTISFVTTNGFVKTVDITVVA